MISGFLFSGIFAFFAASTPAHAGESEAASDDVLLEFHYYPVPGAQIAIWIEDADHQHVQTVMVTQATGKLGIGNRSGRSDFLSSWRAPYGARPSALPIWAHRRGVKYPKIVFFDDDPQDQDSLGWHENSSSPESYFCRPLTPDEHETISLDTMTCPSPSTFQSDKGRFADNGVTSFYPPRNDLISFEASHDSADAQMFAQINDLDAYTSATPAGSKAEFVTAVVKGAVLDKGPISAWIEINLENDQNADYTFEREDHFIDTRLSSYGVPYYGQPSVVYRVAFEANDQGFYSSSDYYGYGMWDGSSGKINLPDATISSKGGSGSDRLQSYTLNGETFRWGVYSHGNEEENPIDPTDDTGGWGQCQAMELPPIEGLEVESTNFDTAEVRFTIPELPMTPDGEIPEIARVRVYYITGENDLDDELLGAAIERSYPGDVVSPGEETVVEVDQLWGTYTYHFGVVYEDKCANESALATASATTPAQEFQTVEGFCFMATAAYGAPWHGEVLALRLFRDVYLRSNPVGRDLVRFYYTYSPPLADIVARQPLLRSMVRSVVQPVADLARVSTQRYR